MYGALLERLAKMCLECPIAHFRRVILLAIEDMGVQLLQAQDEALQRRMLQKMGWAKYQQTQREGAGGVGAGNQMTYYGMITDKASYEDFKHFRDDCKSLQGFVRELFEVQKILLEDDVRDLAGCIPGQSTQHRRRRQRTSAEEDDLLPQFISVEEPWRARCGVGRTRRGSFGHDDERAPRQGG